MTKSRKRLKYKSKEEIGEEVGPKEEGDRDEIKPKI